MFEIASEVLRWHRNNETGVVARVVSVNGLATRWPAEAPHLAYSWSATASWPTPCVLGAVLGMVRGGVHRP